MKVSAPIAWAFWLHFLTLILGNSYESIPICKISEMPNNKSRIIVIGDIHGAFGELMRILEGAKITNGSSCEWLVQDIDTILVQMGDIVDRGDGATEAWECLDMLQRTAPYNSHVARLVGNHELWWLEGRYHMRNKEADSREKVSSIVAKLKAGIHDNSIVAAHVERISNVPVMFVHAGFRRSMMEYTLSNYGVAGGTAKEIVDILNGLLKNSTESCKDTVHSCSLTNMVFGAGPDRGGSGIGGPFWTDFKVFMEEADSPKGGFHTVVTGDPDIMQIVGHTAKPNNIRYTKEMRSICIDSGMVYGVASFLEINTNGRFLVHFMKGATAEVHDLSTVYCGEASPSDENQQPTTTDL